jgi:uncharacterized protein YigA (DUF484 family)
MNEDVKPKLSCEQVENYLQLHPEFFHDHLELLEEISLPHPSGSAISLISKQLEIFRNRHHEQEKQLNALIDIARDNDTSFNRMHELTLSLLDADSLESLIANLDQVIKESFLADFISLKIFKENLESPIASLFVPPEDPVIKHFEALFRKNQPTCGHPTLEQANFLFGDAALEVKSCAIVPLILSEFKSVFAVGSLQKGRFHYSMGNVFLTQIGEIIGARLISLLKS